jgi:hypothetical protein
MQPNFSQTQFCNRSFAKRHRISSRVQSTKYLVVCEVEALPVSMVGRLLKESRKRAAMPDLKLPWNQLGDAFLEWVRKLANSFDIN